jgi:MFS family permease
MPAFLNFCAQVPYSGFSGFLPLWAIGRGVANPGLLFVGSQAGSVVSRLFTGRVADRYGRRIVLAPAMIGVALTLAGMSAAAGLPVFLILSAAYGALYGVAFVVLPGLAGEAAPPEGRGAAINTYGLGADVAQLLGPGGSDLPGEPGASAAPSQQPVRCPCSGPLYTWRRGTVLVGPIERGRQGLGPTPPAMPSPW